MTYPGFHRIIDMSRMAAVRRGMEYAGCSRAEINKLQNKWRYFRGVQKRKAYARWSCVPVPVNSLRAGLAAMSPERRVDLDEEWGE